MSIAVITIAQVNAVQGLAPGETAISSTLAVTAWNTNTAPRAVLILTENTTIQNPTNMVAGERYSLKMIQDDPTAREVAWGSAFQDDTDMPIISTTPGAIMTFEFYSDGTSMFLEKYSVFESV